MNQPKTSEQIRAEFLKFFEEKEHTIVPSDSLVPQNDPTLLFTNAGMNQFKDVFLGTGTRPYRRAADTQKCLRVSGKHNDLEEVGYDTYHHTFFEMLGNWSFGDYFKKEAIRWAWELLVDRWGLDPDRLYATVHEGDEIMGLEPDEEAAAFWRSETPIRPDHVLFCSSKDNFWMMGDTGPCGPCSEIHIDLRSDEERAGTPGHSLVNADDPRVMEIWNLVFIQYNALGEGRLEPLQARHVDTGMGFERMVAVLQHTGGSTYDTDLFAPVLQAIADLSPLEVVKGYRDLGEATAEQREKYRVAMRVIADHIRTIAFAIADGVMPGNVGRGYVIRRILRRAVRYGYQTLGLNEPFLFRLVDVLAAKMGGQFPELKREQAYLERVIRAEEESFLQTLGTGLAYFDVIRPYLLSGEALDTPGGEADDEREMRLVDLLQKAFGHLPREALWERFKAVADRRMIPGEIAFLLHDTYGFPVDLTQLMAREEGLSVDMERYTALMQEQKERARASTSFKMDRSQSNVWQEVSRGDHSYFVGYDRSVVDDAAIRAMRRLEGEDGQEQYELVLDVTPFYAESGGQVGDTGLLRVGDETIRVLDTRKDRGRIIHCVDRLPSSLDAPVRAEVDVARLTRIKKHHSVTHLMHAALREILGKHVKQKGSLVAPDHLRFDFSHYERVSPDQLRAVEQRVNDVIQRNIVRQEERDVPLQDALSRGAMALFGEKYGERVRVITFDPQYSVELCGGLHVDATGEVGLFRFVSEGSVAAGIRRVEAVAGLDALNLLNRQIDELDRIRGQFKSLQRPADEEVADLVARYRQLEKALEEARQARLVAGLDAMIAQARPVGPARLVTGRVAQADMTALRTLGETLRQRLGEGSVGVLGTVDPDGEKVYLVATVSDDLIQAHQLQAGKLVGALARQVGGGGGGRATLATAGGRDPERLDEALAAAGTVLAEMLG